MASDLTQERQRAHALLDRLSSVKLSAVRGLLEAIAAPSPQSNPIDDELETEQERQAVAEATEWLKHNQPIPFEEVLSDFGLTLEDVKNYKESE